MRVWESRAHTCVDELHVALQVAIDHEHLVAARVGAGPLPDLLVVFLYVLLREGQQDPEYAGQDNYPGSHSTCLPQASTAPPKEETPPFLTPREVGAFPGAEGSLLGPGLLDSPFAQVHLSPWEQVDTRHYRNIRSSRSAT